MTFFSHAAFLRAAARAADFPPPGPVDIRVPRLLQRRYSFDSYVVLDRDELYVRYKAVTFDDPRETLLVPDSIVAVTLLRSGLQSVRRTTTFSDYRRFLTSGRIKDR